MAGVLHTWTFPSPRRQAFGGQALVIVRGLRQTAGRITLRAEADGLQAAEAVPHGTLR